MAGFCRTCVPNYGLIAKPLYEALKGEEREPLPWNRDHQQAFEILKTEVSSAPALGLPNLDKPFTLYVREKSGIALGVLTQKLGPDQRPVAYFSEQLDSVGLGWPSCLRAVAATALLVNDASKLTPGQHLDVLSPHQVQSVLEVKGHHWLTGGRLTRYQALLVDAPDITLKGCQTLNPATLLPAVESGDLLHQCIETIEQTYSSRPDLLGEPLDSPEVRWFTDGSSFVEMGTR